VNGLVGVRNWTEFVELSRTQDVMESLWPIEEAGRYIPPSGFENVKASAASSVTVPVDDVSSQWLVLALPPGVSRKGWSLNGEEPIAMNLGVMPAFRAPSQGQLTYRPFFFLYIPLYILSGASLALSLAFLARRLPKLMIRGYRSRFSGSACRQRQRP